jgi:hypothetical protein
MAAKSKPKISAFLGVILPEGMGRALVLSIMASMSLSLYPVNASAAAEPVIIPTRRKIHWIGVRNVSVEYEAVIADPNAVKTKRYQILGFVNS